MQFGFFLLLLAAAVLTNCEVAAASADVTAALSKMTTSSLIADEPDAANKGSRYLRTGVTEDAKRNKQLDAEERLIAWLQSFLAKFGASPKKASPPKADVLPRSKSFSGNDGAVQKLTRSKSLSSLKSNQNLEQVGNDIQLAATANLLKDFKTFEKQGRDPDNMFKFFNLDHRLAGTTEATQHKLLTAAKGSDEVYGQYLLWYQYLSFYKKEHPGWVSTLVKPKLD